MSDDRDAPRLADEPGDNHADRTAGRREGETQTDRDTSYSPSWDRDIEVMQHDQSTQADVDPDRINVLPGTGDPDDTGDVEVDESEIDLPRDPDAVH
jgi:hypothetical protein